MSIEELTEKIAALDLEIQQLKNDRKATLLQRNQDKDDIQRLQKLDQVHTKQNEKLKQKIETLERRIEALRKQKKELEERVKILEEKDRLVEDEIKQLREEMGNQIQLKLEEKMRLEFKKREGDSQEETSLREEVNRLKSEVRNFQEKTADFDTYKKKVDNLEKSMEVIQLGQLFARYMEAIYREILEEYFLDKDGKLKKDFPQPRLRNMPRNIEEFCPEKKEDKEKLWRQQKQRIGYDLANLMEDFSPHFMVHIYRKILPEYFLDKDGRPKRKFQQPSVIRIEEDIKNTYSGRKRKEREKMWKAKQEEIASEFFDYMENMMDERNGVAHPNPLEEKNLRKIAEQMRHPDKSYVEHAIGQLKNTYSYVWGQYFTPLY